ESPAADLEGPERSREGTCCLSRQLGHRVCSTETSLERLDIARDWLRHAYYARRHARHQMGRLAGPPCREPSCLVLGRGAQRSARSIPACDWVLSGRTRT